MDTFLTACSTALVLICDALQKIPSSFWGVIVGSAISIVTVFQNNRASERRLEKQFMHDRDQKFVDRDFSLRRDVYLAATTAIATGIAEIGRFSNFEIPSEQLMARYTEQSPAIAKVHIVAEPTTFKAVLDLVVEINAVAMTLLAKRVPLMVRKSIMGSDDENWARVIRDRDDFLEKIKEASVDPAYPDQRLEALNSNFDFLQRLAAELSAKRAARLQEWSKLQIEYAQECTNEVIRLNELIAPALASVRSELGMHIDANEIRSAINSASERVAAELANFSDRVSGAINTSAA